MAVSATRIIGITFSGDIDSPNLAFNAAVNAASPGTIEVVDLVDGNNAIVCPVGAVGCTILMPTGNEIPVTLKGVNGDTGIALHLTDPSSIAIDVAETASFVLFVDGEEGLTIRIVWT